MSDTTTHAIIGFDGAYRFLSNFHPSPIVMDGMMCFTVEHAFQAMKTVDVEERIPVAAAATPGRAKTRGRQVTLRPDWEQIKDRVMLDCLRAKFACNPKLAAQLDATGDAYLEEGNDWGDRYWGTVGGAGLNMLGLLLMHVRRERRPTEILDR